MEFLGIMLVVGLAVLVYFIPNWIASARKHQNANAIFVLNLTLGWTVLGWLAALIWSLTEVKPPPPPPDDAADTRPCPFCAETIKRQAIRCRYCGSDVPPTEERAAESTSAEEGLGYLTRLGYLSGIIKHFDSPARRKAALTDD